MSKQELYIKIVLAGKSGVGKTTFISSWMSSYIDTKKIHPPTIGFDSHEQNIETDNFNIRLSLHDTAGQERFESLTSTYFRDAHGIIILYSLTDIDSMIKAKTLYFQIHNNLINVRDNVQVIIVANKLDKYDEDYFSLEEAKQLTDSYKKDFIACSSLKFIDYSASVHFPVTRTMAQIIQNIKPDNLVDFSASNPNTFSTNRKGMKSEINIVKTTIDEDSDNPILGCNC